jgi:hypothetical protein
VIEYDIYLPLNETHELGSIKQQLIDRFGGLTDTRHSNKGYWKAGGVVLKDEIVVWRILSEEEDEGERFLKGIKSLLEQKLKQEKILIVKRQVNAL